MMKTDRAREVGNLRNAITEMLTELGISKRVFKRTLPRLQGTGYKYFTAGVNPHTGLARSGHKPSVRQQYSFLKDLVEHARQEKIDIEQIKETEQNA